MRRQTRIACGGPAGVSTSRGMIAPRAKWQRRADAAGGARGSGERATGRCSVDWWPAASSPARPSGDPPRPDVPARPRPTRLRRPGARPAPGVGRPPDVRAAPRPECRRPALELPGRTDHGQQPDGRPPRLGPELQGPVPAVPRHARRGPAVPERLRLPGPVGRGQRREGPGLHVQAGHRGVRDRRVRGAVQAACPDVRRPPDRAEHAPRLLDGLERPRGAAAPARPAQGGPARRSSPWRARTGP